MNIVKHGIGIVIDRVDGTWDPVEKTFTSLYSRVGNCLAAFIYDIADEDIIVDNHVFSIRKYMHM